MKEKLSNQGQAVFTLQKERSFYRQAATLVLLAVAAVLVPRATVYGGLSPFGVSMAACMQGAATPVVCIAAAIGYLLPGGTVLPLRYLAALVAVGGFVWALGGVKRITQSPWFSPLLAAGATFVTGVALNMMGGFHAAVVLTEGCEAILSGGFAYFLKIALAVPDSDEGPRSLTLSQQISLIVCGAVLLMAVDSVTISGISPGRILSLMVILLAARAGRQQGGTLAGTVLGTATVLASPEQVHLAAAYAFGGLLAGIFSRLGKWAASLSLLIVNLLVAIGMGETETVVIGLYEASAAALLYLVLPTSVERAANALFSRAQEMPAVEGLRRSVDMRLTYAADTLKEVAGTVDAVSDKLAAMNAPDLKSVYSGVCEGICRGCYRCSECWKEGFTDTMAAFHTLGRRLRQNGRVEAEDVGEPLKSGCRHLEQVLVCVNSGYAEYVVRENAFHRLRDIRSIVTDQFEGMSALLEEVANDIACVERADLETAARVRDVCERYGMPVGEVACLIGRRERLRLEILLDGSRLPDENSHWHKEICTACGCNLARPTVSHGARWTKLRLTEQARYTVRFGSAQLNCRKEKLCGDAFEQFYDHEGQFCVVLSDGMGTGGRAAVDGAMTAALAGRMMQAGFGSDSILRIINSALILKSGDESLSTLDTLTLDCFTGRLCCRKAGAAPSFLCSRGRVTKITASTLPIGILREVALEEYNDTLRAGDCFVMVSDGVVSDDSTWLETLLSRASHRELDPETLAREIVCTARERQGETGSDDTTALVLRLM